MTGTAVIHDARVTESRRLKAGGLVTADTITVGGHMEIAFSGRGSAVMTGHTVIGDALVFEGGTGKGRGVMAHRAILGCRNVAGVHAFCRTTPVGYMTGRTVIHDAGMIEYGRLEATTGDVADATILGCRNVAGVHAFCRASPIGHMAGIAARG